MRRLRLIKQLHRWHGMSWLDAILTVMTLDNRKIALLEELVRIATIKWLSSFGIKSAYSRWRYSDIKELTEAANASKRSMKK